MATTVSPPEVRTYRDEEYFFFEGGGWELYEQLDAWAGHRPGVKLIYIDGDVVVMAKSRRHNWFALRLHDVIGALARAAGVACEDAGETTYHLREREAGAEGDQSYFLGQNAARMAGPKDFEPGIDPVPDLVVEVEVGNPVAHSLRAWARLGVPEVWHLDASRDELRLRVLRLSGDGTSYVAVASSGFFPVSDGDILTLVRQAATEGAQLWRDQLAARVAQIVTARGQG
jgi:Uma2 family endonuclease